MPQLGVDSHVSFFRDASFPIRWFILERTIKLLRRLPSALVSRAGRNLSLPVPALLPKPPQTFLASRFCSLFSASHLVACCPCEQKPGARILPVLHKSLFVRGRFPY